jgi:pimeloyl-ACP methyl ester carboxylesterase
LTALAERGCTVVAPHFERLLSPLPTDGELLRRARRLSIALGSVARPRVPVAGVGHSIGATMLLALAGGEVWMRPGQRLSIPPERCMDRLVLLAPATGFFQVPGALDAVSTPILAWAGTQDVVTPPAQARALERALGTRVPVEVRIVDGAGHFSFMNVPPPQTTEPLPDRDTFLAELVAEVCRFVTS